MADKMYLIEKAILTSLADRIRNKTGKSDKITFPDEFFDEIANIETKPPTALPVLDANYPQDVTVMESASGSATFNISIVAPGEPAEYTYQWYVNGSAVSDATSLSYTKTELTSAATYNVYCEITNEAGTVTSRVATLTVESSKPVYSFDGTSQLISDDNYNYRIKFKSSGTLKFTSLGCMKNGIDVFCVGGGGGGESTIYAGGGGAGGKTKTSSNIAIEVDVPYTITVGAGGSSPDRKAGVKGGTSSAFNCSAEGGTGGSSGKGGSGGSGGGQGSRESPGSGGSNGGNGGGTDGGSGQGTTTREFGESSGTLYAGGGGGGGDNSSYGSGGSGGGGRGGSKSLSGVTATANTGGGGGGAGYGSDHNVAGPGGSGIVIIRNHR